MARMTKSEALGFFLTGAAVGAAVALLYAPKTGAQARREIRKFSKRTVARLDDLQEDIRDQVTEWVDDISGTVRDGINAGKTFSSDTLDQVMDVFDSAKKAVEDGKGRLQKLIKTA